VIESYNYFAVFLAMLLEGASMPVPSELVLGFAGFLVYQGKLTFTGAVAAGWLGSLTGSLIIFTLARTSGRNLLYKWGYFIHLTPERIDNVGTWFTRYGPALLIPWRIMPVIRTRSSIAAGLLNMHPLIFAVYSAFGIAVWCIIGVTLGLYLGYHWQALADMTIKFSRFMIIGMLLTASTAALLLYSKLHKTKEAP
jgi:membrane protein DedA with SNARE-associated domain